MKRYMAELVVDAHCQLGEGPVWDERLNRLLWVDVDDRKLHIYEPVSKRHIQRELSNRIASMGLREAGGAVAAGERGFQWLDLETGRLTDITDPERHLPHTMFNDGKVDVKGRFYAGTASGRLAPEGALYVLDPDTLQAALLFGGVGCSNGIAWSADNETMFYIDSLAYSIDAWDYAAQSAQVSNRRRLVVYEASSILPDGMTRDEEGMLWVAEWGAGCVVRWDPINARRLAEVTVPARFVTSCAFGGADLDVLYITTASKLGDETEMAGNQELGGLFCVRLDIKGVPGFRFKG